MDSISPNIFVKDISQTIDFYKQLGFTVAATVPDETNPLWVMMNCGKISFMFQTFESLGNELPQVSRNDGGSLLLYIQVNEIRNLYNRINNKVKIIKGLEKTFYGATEFSILDPNGYLLTFAEDESETQS